MATVPQNDVAVTRKKYSVDKRKERLKWKPMPLLFTDGCSRLLRKRGELIFAVQNVNPCWVKACQNLSLSAEFDSTARQRCCSSKPWCKQ